MTALLAVLFGRACFVDAQNSLAPDNRTDAKAEPARGSKQRQNGEDLKTHSFLR
jgi:hypothetical protein